SDFVSQSRYPDAVQIFVAVSRSILCENNAVIEANQRITGSVNRVLASKVSKAGDELDTSACLKEADHLRCHGRRSKNHVLHSFRKLIEVRMIAKPCCRIQYRDVSFGIDDI